MCSRLKDCCFNSVPTYDVDGASLAFLKTLIGCLNINNCLVKSAIIGGMRKARFALRKILIGFSRLKDCCINSAIIDGMYRAPSLAVSRLLGVKEPTTFVLTLRSLTSCSKLATLARIQLTRSRE